MYSHAFLALYYPMQCFHISPYVLKGYLLCPQCLFHGHSNAVLKKKYRIRSRDEFFKQMKF